MKKAAAFILLIILFISAFTPCCVIDNCADEQVAAADHQQQPKEGSDCSPFFTCSSCFGFVSTSKPILLPAFIPDKTIHHEQATTFTLSSYFSELLQPPQKA